MSALFLFNQIELTRRFISSNAQPIGSHVDLFAYLLDIVPVAVRIIHSLPDLHRKHASSEFKLR